MGTPLCMYKSDPGVGGALMKRVCPHPEVLDTKGSVAAIDTCAGCLITHAIEIKEPARGGVWGPVRSLGETLRR